MIRSGSTWMYLPSCSSTERREAVPDSGVSTGTRSRGVGAAKLGRGAERRQPAGRRPRMRVPRGATPQRRQRARTSSGARSASGMSSVPGARSAPGNSRSNLDRAEVESRGRRRRRTGSAEDTGPHYRPGVRACRPSYAGGGRLAAARTDLLDDDLRLGGRLSLEQLHRQHAIGIEGLDLVLLHLGRQPDGPQEPALLPLLPEVVLPLLFLAELALARKGQEIAFDLHVEIVPRHAGGLEAHDELLGRLGEVQYRLIEVLDRLRRGGRPERRLEEPVEEPLELRLERREHGGCLHHFHGILLAATRGGVAGSFASSAAKLVR